MRPEAERLIVHLDDDLAVIEKPAGLVVHSAPSHRGETLVDLLEGIAAGGEGARPGIVHRLDKDTSGLMLVARNEESHRALSRMVKAREVEREYTALVEGQLGSRTGTIDAPLGRHRRQRTKRAVKGAGSREARTHFEVIETLPGDTLAHARLETGRTHQIRVHFAAIGHPVAGDPEYGTRGRHGLERQFLHASRLAFTHPDHRRAPQLQLGPAGRPALRHCGGPGANDARLKRDFSLTAYNRADLHPTPAERHGTLPGPTGFPQPQWGHRTTQAIGRSDGRGRHQGAAGGRSSLRSPDAAMEPAHAPLHLRRAGRDSHHRSPPDGGAAQAGD